MIAVYSSLYEHETGKTKHNNAHASLYAEARIPPMLSRNPRKRIVTGPAPPVIARDTEPEPPRERKGHRLPQPDAAAAKVVDQEPAGDVEPGKHEEEIARPAHPPGHGLDLGLERLGRGGLELRADARQEEEDGRLPPARVGYGRVAAHAVDEAGLDKRDEGADGGRGRGLFPQVAVADHPARGRGEPEPERLVPPGAPEAGQAAVQDLGEGPGHGRQVPRIHAEAEDGRAEQCQQHGAEVPGEPQGNKDGDKGQRGPPEREQEGIHLGEPWRERQIVGAEDEVGVLRHDRGTNIDHEVAGQYALENALRQ